jgi:hypothetical protein
MTARTAPDRDDLRRRFLPEAATALDLRLSQAPDDHLVTFT